ncbi:MAG: hypothetical protein IPJ14_12445 [Kineosporiaceae bacterium]|nr:hypothetical protein [Kineosporiaceae bacterium]
MNPLIMILVMVLGATFWRQLVALAAAAAILLMIFGLVFVVQILDSAQ